MARGNPYPTRYAEKFVETVTDSDYPNWLQIARDLDKEREYKRLNPSYPWEYNIIQVSIAALLAMLRYTGLRISEIVGDRPHRYMTAKGEKFTKTLHGLRKRDVRITKLAIRVDPKEIRKHGKRDEPLWIERTVDGAADIIAQYEATENRDDRIFPLSKKRAWELIKQVAENRYPHYFRLNLATEFAEHEDTSLRDLQEWFAWVDPRTVQKYMGKGGRKTRSMARRVKR